MPTYAFNKTVHRDYQIIETFEAGIVLTGPEVKSVRQGNMNLKASYVTVRITGTQKVEARLINAHISAYAKSGPLNEGYDPTHTRQLLIGKKEALALLAKMRGQALTIVPLKVYNKRSLIKLELGLAKGKKLFDKRETIKKREAEREIARAV